MRNTLQSSCAVALIACVWGGCGGDSITESQSDLATGTFKATVTGSTTSSATGSAVFGTPTAQHLLAMTSVPPTYNVTMVGGAGRPAVGTYAISGTGPIVLIGNVNGNQTVQGASGSLTITTSTTSELAGSFTFTRRDAQGVVLFSVAGTFRAQCGHTPTNCN